MNESSTQLDSDELLHFAIKASQNKDNEKAILYLKHALQQDPENAKLHYFLGAQHAEIGMFDRAIDEMAAAVKLDSSLETAHFQLGLLYATSSRITEAKDAWAPLDKLGEKNPLFIFKTGLLHLANDEFESASDLLTKGIQLNKANPDLNNDMQRILDSIAEVTKNISPANETDPVDKSDESKSGNHVFLSAYNTDDEDQTH